MKINTMVLKLLHPYRQTDRQTDRPILIGTPPSVSETVFEILVKTLPIL